MYLGQNTLRDVHLAYVSCLPDNEKHCPASSLGCRNKIYINLVKFKHIGRETLTFCVIWEGSELGDERGEISEKNYIFTVYGFQMSSLLNEILIFFKSHL